MYDNFLRIGNYLKKNGDLRLPSPPSEYRWSDAIWVSERDEWIALYRPLNLGVMYLHRNQVKGSLSIQTLKSTIKLSDALVAEKFLVPLNGETDDQDHQELIARARGGTFRFICILPTTACNLKCLYCHQRTEEGKERHMTKDEIISGMDKCAELCTDLNKPVDILLYGGEPLIAFPLTEEILNLTHPSNGLFQQKVRLSFTTSGYGLTASQANTLIEHDVFVIISLDGKPQCNDKVRPSINGTSSFEVGRKAYNMLKECGGRVGLSVTIGKHNIEDLAHHVEFLLDTFQPNDIGLNAFLHRRGDKQNPFQVNGSEAFTAFINCFNVTRKFGIYAEQPFRRMKPFVFRKPLLKDCSSPGERLVLAPGGMMGFCDSCFPDQRYFYPIDDFPYEDHPDFRLWSRLSAPDMPQCRICPAMTVCGGACRYDAFKASGQLDGVDPERCKFELAFLNWMIWELWEKVRDKTASIFFPNDEERGALFENVSLHEKNQPFTAGSYSE